MKPNLARIRNLHRYLAPFLCFPLFLTLITGLMFQIAALGGQGSQFLWLLDLHRGKFGQINLEFVYPFFNAFGLLTLIITGTLMWLKTSPKRPVRSD